MLDVLIKHRVVCYRYALAAILVCAGAVLPLVIHAYLGDGNAAYLVFTGVVVVASIYGGLGPAILATLLSTAVLSTVSTPSADSGQLLLSHRMHLVLFTCVGLLIALLNHVLRSASRKANNERLTAEIDRHRISFIAEAGALLDSSQDFTASLGSIARLTVPFLADWCVIDIRDDNGNQRTVIPAHGNPSKLSLLEKLCCQYPTGKEDQNPMMSAFATGKTQNCNSVSDDDLIKLSRNEEHLNLLRQLCIGSCLCVPISVKGRTFGSILLISSRQNRYDLSDVALAEDLGHRAALAVDNARLLLTSREELSERMKVEVALRASESRLSGIIGSAMDAIISVDENRNIVVFNRAAETMFGCSADYALGMKVDAFIPERLRDLHADHIRTFSRTGITTRSMVSPGTLYARRFDGTEFPIEATISQVFTDKERLFTVIMRDVTERMASMEQIQQLNERLQRSITETHHRVKNNLQVIAAMVDMKLMDGQIHVPVDEYRRLGNYVRALALVHDILTHESRDVAASQFVSARAMLEKLLPLIRQTYGDCDLRYCLDDTQLSTRQSTSLALVINELVSNAMKHGNGYVEVKLAVRNNAATLQVIDDGPGFPEDFNPSKAANTGLELVENLSRWDLGGAASYENLPEGGGKVSITIPLAA